MSPQFCWDSKLEFGRFWQADLVGFNVFAWGQLSKRTVGSVIIIVTSPRFDDVLCLLQGFEFVSIQTFVAEPTIE
ncbi:hypothetical protein SAMN05216386_0104 [Nitrosospira briensis]|uniref:Uncharacterized protein n=1 Tax=Nitrosospira briensis TaxID=35799 RepID=A0A1I4XFQ8_9PROT|nr:hypothetical protein SAMN05216386_0104 [Nitrosospira briensis]